MISMQSKNPQGSMTPATTADQQRAKQLERDELRRRLLEAIKRKESLRRSKPR